MERPTIQQRFAPRAKAFALWLGGVGHVRDDYYSSWGVSAAASYMWSDSYGLELGARHLWTSLSDEAVLLRDGYGLTPDARPQSWAYSLGLLLGAGYAKALFGQGVTHIDPLIGLHVGLAHADERLIPTLRGVVSPVLLMRGGVKVRLELAATLQFEQRERGLVISTGFLPGVSVGWGETTQALRERVFPSKPAPLKAPERPEAPR